MIDIEPAPKDTPLGKGIMFAMVALTVLGGWWKLNEKTDKQKGRGR